VERGRAGGAGREGSRKQEAGREGEREGRSEEDSPLGGG